MFKHLIVNKSGDPTVLGMAVGILTTITGVVLLLYPAKLVIVGGMGLLALPPKMGMAMCWVSPHGEWCSEYEQQKYEDEKDKRDKSCAELLKDIFHANEDYKNGTGKWFHRDCECISSHQKGTEALPLCIDTPIRK